jgi:hypothetical protein
MRIHDGDEFATDVPNTRLRVDEIWDHERECIAFELTLLHYHSQQVKTRNLVTREVHEYSTRTWVAHNLGETFHEPTFAAVTMRAVNDFGLMPIRPFGR